MRVGLPVMIATALQNAVAVHSCLTRRSGAKERNFPVDWASVQCIVKIYSQEQPARTRFCRGQLVAREQITQTLLSPPSPTVAISARVRTVTRVVAEFEEMPASADCARQLVSSI